VNKQTEKAIPELEFRDEIIAECHSLGHLGVTRAACLVRTNFWWWGLKDQVKKCVWECSECKLMRAKFNEPLEMQPIPVEGVYHMVGVDMTRPLQTSASGNRYIITTIDYMTKNLEAAAVSGKSSKSTAKFFDREVICRSSTPAEVVTDQGGEFRGDFKALLDRCGNDHGLTGPYHPQANALTERANQTLIRALEDPLNWDKQIPRVLLGCRSSAQASTNSSPFFLLHGHLMVLPLGDRHRANMEPLYDDVPPDSKITKQLSA